MYDQETTNSLSATLQQYDLLPVATVLTFEQLHRTIADRINVLITTDFSRLISVLYRLDIPEKKLKGLLSGAQNTPAADIIATLIIERQLQKMESRKAYRNTDFSEEEKW